MRFTSQGTAMTTFRIAVPRRTRSGGDEDDPDWFRIVTWDRLAEVCNEHLCKGRRVLVVGRLRTSVWEAEDGGRRRTVEVVAYEVTFLDAPPSEPLPGGDAAASPPSPPPRPPSPPPSPPPSGGDGGRGGKVVDVPVNDDDLPF